MNEESEVRGCYNNFYLHQPGNGVGSLTESEALVPWQQLTLNNDLLHRDTGGKRKQGPVQKF